MDLLGAYGSDSDEQDSKNAPVADAKKKICFTLPIAVAPSKKYLQDDVTEEDSILQRKSQAATGGGLLSFLPPPKNPSAMKLLPAKRPDVDRAGVLSSVEAVKQEETEPLKPAVATTTTRRPLGRLLDPSDFVPVKRAKPEAFAAPNLTPAAPAPVHQSPATGPYPPPEFSAVGPYPPAGDGYAEYLPEPEEYETATGPYPPPPVVNAPTSAVPPPEFGRMRGMPNFIEVNAQDLRATAAQQKARLTDTIKPDSEFRVDPLFMPSADQRRKHQLSYLVYDAKMKEQQLNEARREAARTKAEVKAKYGW